LEGFCLLRKRIITLHKSIGKTGDYKCAKKEESIGAKNIGEAESD
jgi:hypothetical protein